MSMPPPPGGPATSINSSAFADELRQAVYQGMLEAMGRVEGKSLSSLQSSGGFSTVAPVGQAPMPERPEFTRTGGGALSALFSHGTSLLGHQVFVPGQQRVWEPFQPQNYSQHVTRAKQDLEQEHQDAKTNYQNLIGQNAPAPVRQAAFQKYQAARTAVSSKAAIDARATDYASQAAKGIASSWGMRGRAAVAGGLMGAGGEGGILGGMTEAVPEVGIPLMAVKGIWEGANEVADQRAQNAQYQSIYGGSNIAGMGQRISELGFRLRNVGDLTGQQAEEAFQGISQFGIQGSQRQQMLDTLVKEYNQYGLQISDTLKIMTTAIQHGNESLTGFTDSINTVVKAARTGGVNVGAMVQGFGQQLATAAPLYGAGPGVMGNQANLAAAAGQSGQVLGNAFNQGQFGFYNSQQTLNEVVGMTGMSAGDVMAMGQDPSQSQNFSGIQQGVINKLLNSTGLIDVAQQAIQAYKQKNPSVSYQQMTASNVLQEIAIDFEHRAGNRMYALQGMAQQMGINMDTQTLVQYILQIGLHQASGGQAGWQYGNQNTGKVSSSTQKAFQSMGNMKGLSGYNLSTLTATAQGGTAKERAANAQDIKAQFAAIGVDVSTKGGSVIGNNNSRLNSGQEAYVSAFYDKGMSDTGVAGLLKSGKWNNTKFDVSGGPQHQTVTQLLDLYKKGKITQDQLDQATVSGQGEKNKSIIGEQLQYLGNGQTSGDGSGGKGSVLFDLTPSAAAILRSVHVTGAVSQANGANLPATGNYVPGSTPATNGSSG